MSVYEYYCPKCKKGFELKCSQGSPPRLAHVFNRPDRPFGE